MANKFDTNPLDPEFPERSRAAANTEPAGGYTAPTRFKTAEFQDTPPSITEDETRRFATTDLNGFSYGAPIAVADMPAASMSRADKHTVAKIGLPEKWIIGLPYIPFYIGLIAGVVLLLMVPKEESKVRFHAAQGLAAHVGILIVTGILGALGNVTGIAELANLIFTISTIVMLLCFAYKAFQGKPVHIESVDELTNWMEDKIGPVN